VTSRWVAPSSTNLPGPDLEAVARGAIHGVDIEWHPLQCWLEAIVNALVTQLLGDDEHEWADIAAGKHGLLALRSQLEDREARSVEAAIRLTGPVKQLLDRASTDWTEEQLEEGLTALLVDYRNRYRPGAGAGSSR
jgi:hypothetical protein